MIVLGIDPGLATVGFGVIQKNKHAFTVITYGCIQTSPTLSLAERIAIVYGDVRSVIQAHKPALVGIEKLFFFKNQKTVMEVSQARGGIMLATTHENVPILELTPLEVKQTVSGYGRATKLQVQTMIQKILTLKKPPRPDDAADALAIAYSAAIYST